MSWLFGKNDSAKSDLKKMVSVRMEAIGGQGANSAGKILAEAAVLGMGYTGNHFSSFGSEKRGAPVRSYVRFSTDHRPIRNASAISHPDLIVIFHESLIFSHQEILDGVTTETDLVINTNKRIEDIEFPQGICFNNIVAVDATTIALNNSCGLNAVMLGALSQICPEVDTSILSQTMTVYFSNLPEIAIKNNLKGFSAGAKHFKFKKFQEKQSHLEVQVSSLPQMGWMNAPIGGVIINPGNSVLKNHSASRKGVAPQFNKEICFNCGFCDMVCPDFCFVWEIDPDGKNKPDLKGIDYQYCKGCQKCITVCPVEALVPVAETSLTEDQKKERLFPEIDPHLVEEQWKKMDWIKYVEELSKDGQMMSLQTELLNPQSYLRPLFENEVLEKLKKDFKK
jgi:pyruvate ferredoxin oxidoreductase gamma subunit